MARKPARVPLERDEMVLILENIARGGSDTARIAAIKTLTTLKAADDDDNTDSGFGALDPQDELESRRQRKTA